jgi:hypothetical protein
LSAWPGEHRLKNIEANPSIHAMRTIIISVSYYWKELLIARRRVPKFFQGLADREAAGLLARWELLEARQMLRHERLCWDEHKGVLHEPSYVIAGLVLGSFKRVCGSTSA